MSLAAVCDDHVTWEEWRACKVCRPRKVKAVKDEKRPPWYANPRVILAWTVPLAFTGIVIGKTVNDEAALEATVAGGLWSLSLPRSLPECSTRTVRTMMRMGHEREEAEEARTSVR